MWPLFLNWKNDTSFIDSDLLRYIEVPFKAGLTVLLQNKDVLIQFFNLYFLKRKINMSNTKCQFPIIPTFQCFK